MGNKNIIGQRIKTMRLSRRMTQEDLARAIDQSQSSITMYETGRREPDFETLEALADVFNVPIASFIDGGSIPPETTKPAEDELRILIPGLSKLPPERIERAKNAFLAMFKATYPELFEKEGDDDK